MDKEIRVLIVDDEEIVVRGIKKGLEHSGFIVNTAIGGEEALSIFKQDFHDVVIVDLIMPGMNGIETCKELKIISKDVEVLLLSGFPEEVEKFGIDFLKAGGKDLYLRKPLLVLEVKDAILKILEK